MHLLGISLGTRYCWLVYSFVDLMVRFVPLGDPKVPPSSQDERRFKDLCYLEALFLSFSSVYSGGDILFLPYLWSTQGAAITPLLWLIPRWVCWCSISTTYLHKSLKKVFSNQEPQNVIYLQMKLVACRGCF